MLRVRVRAAVVVLATAAALATPMPLLGQEGNGPTPGQNRELINALSERVMAIEGKDAQDAWDWLATWPAIVAVVALLEVVHRVLKAIRSKSRPILAWSAFDDGLKFSLRDAPGGAKFLAVRVTNVGQAAAVDIVGRAGVTLSAKRARVRVGSRPHHVGSLYPGASTQVFIPLSDAEYRRALGGEAMAFRVLLRYGAMGGRRYAYSMSGMRSGGLSVMVGIVGKALPAHESRGLYGAGSARARGQSSNVATGGDRP